MGELKLTPTEQRVFDVLDGAFECPTRIVQKAGLRSMSASERAAHYCIRLVKKGLAEKGGTAMFPSWRRVQTLN